MNVNYFAGISAIIAGLLIITTSVISEYLQNCTISNPCSTGSMVIIDANFVIGPVLFMLGLWQIGYEHRRKSRKLEEIAKTDS